MSDETKSAGDGPADMMRLWGDMASRATEACQAWSGAAISPDAFRQGRSDLFKLWSDYWEHFMRSASFLEAEKRGLSGTLEYRKQFREYLERLHHEMQLPSSQDIDHLMVSVRRIGEDLREHFDQMAERLDGLSAQLDTLAARLEALEERVAKRKTAASSVPSGENQPA